MKPKKEKKSLKDLFKTSKKDNNPSCGCSFIIEDIPEKDNEKEGKKPSNGCGC